MGTLATVTGSASVWLAVGSFQTMLVMVVHLTLMPFLCHPVVCVLMTAVSPEKTPREYYSRDHDTQKQQCFRVYRGLGYKEVCGWT